MFRNKTFKYNDNYRKGTLAPSLSTGNLYPPSQPNFQEFPEVTQRISAQNYQNRRKYNPGK